MSQSNDGSDDNDINDNTRESDYDVEDLRGMYAEKQSSTENPRCSFPGCDRQFKSKHAVRVHYGKEHGKGTNNKTKIKDKQKEHHKRQMKPAFTVTRKPRKIVYSLDDVDALT